MKILVLGGAGYIGSHMAKLLVNSGYEVVIFDNLSTGFRSLARYGVFVHGDVTNANDLDRVFEQHRFDAVMHFAAASLVGESIDNPAKYYINNVAATLTLLEAMRRHSITTLVFSSTAAVYGEPHYTPIDEQHPKLPINPYGASKWMVEQVLADYASAYGIGSVRLRYFNAAGADPAAELGECHDPETHLIPLILQAASGRREGVKVFGTNYPTADGTCVRDYIHVADLCGAHLRSLEFLSCQPHAQSFAFNLGIGHGFSVREVIATAQQVVAADGCEIHVEYALPRPGDPAVLVADASLAQQQLGWSAQYTQLEQIISHAWEWEKQYQAARTKPNKGIPNDE